MGELIAKRPMNEQSKKFPDGPLLPIIHLRSPGHAVEMAGLARELGAGGIFLTDSKISTRDNPKKLLQATEAVMSEHYDLWLGVNCQTRTPDFVIKNFDRLGVDGVWADNATSWLNVQKVNKNNLEGIDNICRETDRARRHATALYFGGLAMRGNGFIANPYEAAAFLEATHHHTDVVTISGPGFAEAEGRERVVQSRRAIGREALLAVYQGIDHLNIGQYIDEADYFLLDDVIGSDQNQLEIDPRKFTKISQAHKQAVEQTLYQITVGKQA